MTRVADTTLGLDRPAELVKHRLRDLFDIGAPGRRAAHCFDSGVRSAEFSMQGDIAVEVRRECAESAAWDIVVAIDKPPRAAQGIV
jgi:hypothetical protein